MSCCCFVLFFVCLFGFVFGFGFFVCLFVFVFVFVCFVCMYHIPSVGNLQAGCVSVTIAFAY